MPRRALLLLSVLAFAACDREAETVDPDLEDATGAAAPPAPEETAPAPAGLTRADCLVGTWAMDAEHSFRPETWASLAPGGDTRFEYGGSSGRALLTFAAGGGARQQFERFSLTLNGDTSAGEMSTTVAFDGAAEGRYAVEGDRLRLTPGEADLTSRVQATVGGRAVSSAEVDVESLFESGEGSLLTFTCRGGELLLDVHESAEGGRVLFDDARYTRVSGGR
jgi:hypothetical protein